MLGTIVGPTTVIISRFAHRGRPSAHSKQGYSAPEPLTAARSWADTVRPIPNGQRCIT